MLPMLCPTNLLSKIEHIQRGRDGKIFQVIEWRWGCVRLLADRTCYEEPINWSFWSNWTPLREEISEMNDVTPSLISVSVGLLRNEP